MLARHWHGTRAIHPLHSQIIAIDVYRDIGSVFRWYNMAVMNHGTSFHHLMMRLAGEVSPRFGRFETQGVEILAS
jgi:hypothetical protein